MKKKQDTKYFFLKVEIKDYNVMIDGQKFFDQLAKNYLRTYDSIQKLRLFQEMII